MSAGSGALREAAKHIRIAASRQKAETGLSGGTPSSGRPFD
jgi:hypothetical protein